MINEIKERITYLRSVLDSYEYEGKTHYRKQYKDTLSKDRNDRNKDFENASCDLNELEMLELALDCFEKVNLINLRRSGSVLEQKQSGGKWVKNKNISFKKTELENIRVWSDNNERT